MLNTLDTVIAFAVIMTVLSLLITILVQMASAALSLRGKNLVNALALTFQTIDPKLQEQAYSLAAQILRDPIFSDSAWRSKDRKLRGNPATQAQARVERAEKDLRLAEEQLATVDKSDASSTAQGTARRDQANNALTTAKQKLESAKQTYEIEELQVQPNRTQPWGVFQNYATPPRSGARSGQGKFIASSTKSPI